MSDETTPRPDVFDTALLRTLVNAEVRRRFKEMSDTDLLTLYLFSDMLPGDDIDAVETEMRKRKLSLRAERPDGSRSEQFHGDEP